MAEDQALSVLWVLSAAPRGPGFAPTSLLPGPPAQFLLGAGGTRGCGTQGSGCIQMCSQCRVLCGMQLLPVLPWLGGLAGVPVPAVSGGEQAPRFHRAEGEGCRLPLATETSHSFSFREALLRLRCLLGLPGELRSGLFGVSRPPKIPQTPWKSPRSWRRS